MSITHEPQGSPPVIEHAASYHHFVIAMRYIVLALAVTITFLLMVFGFGTSWLGAALVAAVELAVGLYFARDRHTQSEPG